MPNKNEQNWLTEEEIKKDFQVTVVLFKDDIIAIESGDGGNKIYGVAFGIRATTIARYLLNLPTFKIITIETSDNS